MPAFFYRGFNSEGKPISGLIEAIEIKSAKEKLLRSGIMVQVIETASSRSNEKSILKILNKQLFNTERRAFLYEEIASMLAGGMPVLAIFETLMESPEINSSERSAFAALLNRMKEGASLSTAIRETIHSASSYEVVVISAGEKAGNLVSSLKELANFLKKEAEIKEEIITASIYPLFVFCCAIFIAIAMLGFALPHTVKVLTQNTKIVLPLITRLMMGISTIFVNILLPVLIVISIAGFFFFRKLIRKESNKTAIHKWLLGVPLFGELYAKFCTLRFAHTLATLLAGGAQPVESVIIAGESTGNIWIQKQIAKAAKDVENGAPISNAIAGIRIFSELISWIRLGESTGKLAENLQVVAERLELKWKRLIKRRVSAIEPALIIITGIFVLLVVISILLPIISMQNILKAL